MFKTESLLAVRAEGPLPHSYGDVNKTATLRGEGFTVEGALAAWHVRFVVVEVGLFCIGTIRQSVDGNFGDSLALDMVAIRLKCVFSPFCPTAYSIKHQ